MTKPKPVHYVESFGGIWKLSAKEYRRMREALAEGRDVDLDDFGKLVLVDAEKLSDLQNEVLGTSSEGE